MDSECTCTCILTCTSSGQVCTCALHLCEWQMCGSAARANGAACTCLLFMQNHPLFSPHHHQTAKLEMLGNSMLHSFLLGSAVEILIHLLLIIHRSNNKNHKLESCYYVLIIKIPHYQSDWKQNLIVSLEACKKKAHFNHFPKDD